MPLKIKWETITTTPKKPEETYTENFYLNSFGNIDSIIHREDKSFCIIKFKYDSTGYSYSFENDRQQDTYARSIFDFKAATVTWNSLNKNDPFTYVFQLNKWGEIIRDNNVCYQYHKRTPLVIAIANDSSELATPLVKLEYAGNGRIKVTRNFIADQLTHYTTYEQDDFGNDIRSYIHDVKKDTEYSITKSYTYDTLGNWLSRKTFDESDSTTTIEKREIIYFPSGTKRKYLNYSIPWQGWSAGSLGDYGL
jgi:hypothetical protein